MAAQKRTLDDSSSSHKKKKSRTESSEADAPQPTKSSLVTTQVDFPRGGGTSFTPLEVKAIRAEATKEADAELFKDASNEKKTKKRKRKSEAENSTRPSSSKDKEKPRIENINYKRINIGMKIFGQIISILPLALIISLPNQLFAHVPITNISFQLTERLERAEEEELKSTFDDDEDEEMSIGSDVPELTDLFSVGQYVRAVASAVHQPGTSDVTGLGKSRDELSKAGRRVELSLIPERVNSGVQKSDLRPGFTLTAAIRSREDHGYILDFGIPEISGFLPLADAPAVGRNQQLRLHIGGLLDVTIVKMSANGRTCTISADPAKFSTSFLSEVSSVTSILPGALVQALITSVNPDGLNLQVLGFFEGTVGILHLEQEPDTYKVGKKVKARILYDYSASPPKFALALSEHIVKLSLRLGHGQNDADEKNTLQVLYPIGTALEAVKVLRVEAERGLLVEVGEGVRGFVHISHTSDDHVPSLSTSGPWKPGTIHPARVTGYFTFDGLLQLSLKPSVIQQKYFQVHDVEVGEIVKGTIKKLTDSGLFVSLSGGVDGVVWPNHYADITLKHPAKRFKEGANIKCRVLVVDPDRKRISLTAKKTLLESDLPIIAKPEDIVPGKVTHAVVFKLYDKHLLVEFYNNLKAIVPAKEISEIPKAQLAEAFPVGRVVCVRILSNDEGRITASIRQAASVYDLASDISAIEIGNTVEGTVSEIHKDNVLLTLQPSRIRALLSLKNLSNHRNLTVAQLRAGLNVGEKLEELVVVTRNPEKALVLVANKPKTKALTKGSNVTMESVSIGQLVGGRVIRHIRHAALVKISAHIGGILHFTDISDDFSSSVNLPPIDSIIKAVVIAVDAGKRQLTLSTRQSRMTPDQAQNIIDPEIGGISDVQVGQSVRGFVKNIAGHGLFVTIGREVDARVQIKELFDDFVKEWQIRFKEHQLVKGRILSVDAANKKIEISFRSSEALRRPSSSSLTLSDLKEGQKVDGRVKKIEDYGLFIQIEGSKLSGLCHKSQLSDNPDADVGVALRGFREGDRVKALVLRIENKKVSLSLRPSHFSEEDLQGDDDVEMEDGDVNLDEDGGSAAGGEGSDDEDQSQEEDGFSANEDEDGSDEEKEIDISNVQLEYQGKQKPSASATSKVSLLQTPSLTLEGGFQWSADTQHQDNEAESSSEDEDEDGQPSKKKRKKKQIELDLTADMHTKTPESNADFERLLLGSPNSSYLWIQYMSFQLPLSEVDKAREIARRAIRTINFREEKERLNIWIALLNLENVYDTDESLDVVFKEAARANDSKTIHLRLAAIFDQSDKTDKAEEQYKKTCKKFGQSSKVWTLFGEFQLKRGNVEEARKLLPRSLQSLEKRKHLKTISKFAQLEYKYGEPERGKTLFEGIVDSHPKRWDMWSVYMDMEATQGNIQGLRNLFDRVLALKMTSHKAKSFFKKWLEFEKRIGDEDGVKTVKEKAIEWTQKALNAS